MLLLDSAICRSLPSMAKKKAATSTPTSDPSSEESATSLPAEAVIVAPDGDFPVVGIGASAGGLDAFVQLLKALPSEPNFAGIIVQHMSPQHESALPTLLRGSTTIPVVEVQGTIKLEPGTFYVVPPNRTLVLVDGSLQLQPRPLDATQFHPIDAFFRSLAEKMGNRAVAVILSGMGSDGAKGVQAIKEAGGITIAQDPDSSKYDSMPRAAMATDKIDLVLNPSEIAAHLVQLAKGTIDVDHLPRLDSASLDGRNLERIFALLRSNSGVDFSQYKLPTVQRRIQRRMAMHKLASVDDYVRYLQENPPEVNLLYQDILIHVTRFFREPESFHALSEVVFPALLAERSGDSPLRIWVPGCSTGEEAYSIAIALVDYLEESSSNAPIQIFATDVSERSIETARTGVFPATITEDVSPERMRRYFSKIDGQYRINKSIRDMCVFALQDLTRDPPFSKLDLIVCRNVLIYLGQAVQSRLINVFHYALKSTGFLMLGSAETIGVHGDLFAVAEKKNRVYRKKLGDALADMHFSVPFTRPMGGRTSPVADEPRGTANLQGEVNRLMLDRYTPPGVLVNEDLRIVQFRGQTGKYLEPAPGDASLNLLKMCREGLLHGLRTAIQNAKKKNASVRREGLRVKSNGGFTDIAVEVVPINAGGDGLHFLILFQDTPQHASKEPQKTVKLKGKKGKPAPAEWEQEIERLQSELVASREYLQSIIQDWEAANEELQSANEEILSSNEELQSTNEELDTAKEELQSTNEELNTVNEELHGRNEELARINSDLVNLLNGVRIAIVIVTGDLRIRRFTPMAERVLNLIPGDIGRPIGQIKPNINCPDLEQLIMEAIDGVSVQQREVQDSQGRWHSLTIRPYKNVDNRIDGAVLALFDIDEVRKQESQTQEAREFADTVLQTVGEPLLVVDADKRICKVNEAFCRSFNVNERDVEKAALAEAGGGQWNMPQLLELIDQVLQGPAGAKSTELTHDFAGASRRTLQIDARRIGAAKRRNAQVLLALRELQK